MKKQKRELPSGMLTYKEPTKPRRWPRKLKKAIKHCRVVEDKDNPQFEVQAEVLGSEVDFKFSVVTLDGYPHTKWVWKATFMANELIKEQAMGMVKFLSYCKKPDVSKRAADMINKQEIVITKESRERLAKELSRYRYGASPVVHVKGADVNAILKVWLQLRKFINS
jgi:hypothetical protein